MSGWISIHRKIQNHWVWDEKPFDKRSAWIDLILSANYKENTFLLGNELVKVERGSFITSEVKLSEKWGWSRTKVRNFLNLLEKDNMLIKESSNKRTALTIVSYNDYQVQETSKEQQEDIKKTSKEHQKNTNNKENKDNKDNNKSLCMYDENLKEIVRLLENNIGVIPPILIDEIYEYSKVFDLEMFGEAIKIAANNKKRTVNYIIGILRKWKDANVLTINDLEALRIEKEVERESKRPNYPKGKQSYSRANKTRFHNFEQRSDGYSDEQLEDVVARKRREYTEKINKDKKAL